eukprot:Seg3315.3 transcript_id=Seg3315.3/GoldUCD/mRNA.D3Y31 product="hypothetical protein" protein_id=Seg3315.3/GoldUCD/D3Y31
MEQLIDRIKHLATYKKQLRDIVDEHAYAKQINFDKQDSSKDQDSIQNVYDDNHGEESCPGARNTDQDTKDRIGESDSDQRVRDPSERCNTLKEIREGSFQGRPIKIEDPNVDNTELDERASNMDLHTRQTYPCDVAGTFFQGEQVGANAVMNIKQEEDSDLDDYDNEASFTREFLEDSCDDLHNEGVHHNQELMPAHMMMTSVATDDPINGKYTFTLIGCIKQELPVVISSEK